MVQLLQLGEDSSFDLMITADQKIAYQQNLRGRKIKAIAAR
jgi:hypothetical protein